MADREGKLFVHKKTGKIYQALRADVTNATNEQDGEHMILYVPHDQPDGPAFVREREEFMEKFEAIDKVKGSYPGVLLGERACVPLAAASLLNNSLLIEVDLKEEAAQKVLNDWFEAAGSPANGKVDTCRLVLGPSGEGGVYELIGVFPLTRRDSIAARRKVYHLSVDHHVALKTAVVKKDASQSQ
jgi:hypothetical protein